MDPFREEKTAKAIPIAIIFGFALIALAIYFTGANSAPTPVVSPEEAASTTPALTGTPKPVDQNDYIRGNPNAPILLIEYSDYDCPFCKEYHDVLTQVINEYGVTGKVAWVYRQFPISQLHPNAPKISEAALCVGFISGQDAFWQFTDLVFIEREVEEQTNMVLLPDYAEAAGSDRAKFEACLENGDMTDRVTQSTKDGFDIGARGTPYTVLMVGNEQAVINGAQSYDTVSGIIDNLLQQLEGRPPAPSTDSAPSE